MKKIILSTLVSVLTSLTAFANSGRDASVICMNEFKEIDSRGYFHYVFPSAALKGASKVEILDYAADYKKIQATVKLYEPSKFLIEDKADGFQLIIDLNQKVKPGPRFGSSGWVSYVTHKNQKNYQIKCVFSGSIELE